MADDKETVEIPTVLPLDAVSVDPAGLGTADCSLICRASDGCDYAIKDAVKVAAVPHSEWFCTRLGDVVGIAGPPCKVIRMPDGTLVFGSRWEGGLLKEPWYVKVYKGELAYDPLKPALSRIYAYDLLIHNVDRHGGNVLAREQYKDAAILAFDYSRAWLVNGFPPADPPMPHTHNTVHVQRQITTFIGPYIDPKVCSDFLDHIKKVKKYDLKHIINSHPDTWLSPPEADAIMHWWDSPTLAERADKIAKGIDDGTYL